MRGILLPAVLALPLALGGCSDDGATLPDSRAPDQQTGDVSIADLPPADGPLADAPVPDGPQTDAPPAPEEQGPEAAPPDQGPQPDGPKTCSADKECKVFEDCCDCYPIYTWESPGMCKMACTDKACKTDLNLVPAEAHCVKGKCFLGGGTCASDADCQMVNDCCSCMALPAKSTPPACNIKACFVATCTARGVSTAKAQCVSGSCRVVP